jgi:hypothetical protein
LLKKVSTCLFTPL